jgi:MFS transporter, DHA1 family, inner membrane transport protein
VRESVTSGDAKSAARPRAALVALGLAAFVLGTAEFVIVGVLDLVARDLRVSIATAGHLVMAYALGISIGGPIVTAMAVRMDRRRLLAAALLVFIAANLAIALSFQQYLLLSARFVSGAMHGLFVGVASTAATQLVPANQRRRAMSMVFGGIALATVLGVPAGTYVAHLVGWQACFVVIAVLALVSLCATLALLPEGGQRHRGGVFAQARDAFVPSVLATGKSRGVIAGGPGDLSRRMVLSARLSRAVHLAS